MYACNIISHAAYCEQAGTGVTACFIKHAVRAPSAQKRKAAELETVETEEREEAAEIQRHHKQVS